MIGFFSLVEQKLGQRGRSTDFDAERLAERVTEVIDRTWHPTGMAPPPMPVAPVITDLTAASDSEVIHEALGRGYAVMRLPEPPRT